ncbi:dynein regulatory complex protein 10-like isoform X2 [Choristoneura fumiferana]|uniref:dynein regulatory complex protein 10-like isoform X2 n=1 Tax=Choristoneura fumiferana TaxID=7141 RepID=UPI003D1555E7
MRKAESTTFSQGTEHSESSRTDSSGAQSADKVIVEEDFTKDNAASPIDLECHIQAERITKILTEAIYKTSLALCLPVLVRDRKILASTLTRQHLDEILMIHEQYDNPLFSISLLNVSAMDDIQNGDMSLKNRLNPELGHLISILNTYPALKPKIDNLVEKGKDPLPGLLYLLELEHLREQMEVQMELTAADELRAKFKTRKLEGSNAELMERIKEYSTCLKEETESFEKEMLIKEETIRKLEQELSFFYQVANSKLTKKIVDSDRQMVLASRAHAVKDAILQEEEIEVRETYEKVLRAHILLEKNQRARRSKVETQLLSWLQKYDGEMREKQVDLDELTKKYEDELEKIEILEEKLAKQNVEFDPLMKEREDEYHAELAEKQKIFLVEHAARVIQVAWRDTIANRAEKKKLKKLQKKQQAQAEAEARAAELAAKKAAAALKKAEKEAKAAAKAEKEAEKKAKLEAAKAAKLAEKEEEN